MPGVIIAPEQLPPWALRTEIPTVVADLCEDACDLAVWRAVRWLIALAGRDRLGVDARTIAAHAKVDVKTALRCINGDSAESRAKRRPRSPKRGLIGLGLLEVVGHQAVGKLKPRPVYRIPRWIEEQNAHYTRELLARLGVEPPAPAPPPAQAPLPLGLDPHAEQAGEAAGSTPPAQDVLDPHVDQVAARKEGRADPHVDQGDAAVPFLDQGAGIIDLERQDAADLTPAPAVPDPNPEQESKLEQACPDPKSERWREGRKEGGREGIIHPPPTLSPAPETEPEIRVRPTQPGPDVALTPLPLMAVGGEGYAPLPPRPLGSQPPPAPPARATFAAHPRWVAGALPAHPLDLWRRACPARRAIDDDQLAVLASEHDGATSGHGWYWVGRAILAAAVTEDIHSIAKVRRTLERWRAEDAYGSDVPASGRRPAAPPAAQPERAARQPSGGRAPLSARMNLGTIFEEI